MQGKLGEMRHGSSKDQASLRGKPNPPPPPPRMHPSTPRLGGAGCGREDSTAGWENRIAQLPSMYSWKLILPYVESAVKSCGRAGHNQLSYHPPRFRN